MPQGCGVSIHVGPLLDGCVEGVNPRAYSLLLYYKLSIIHADDVVLLSHHPAQLAAMLTAVDQVAQEYGLTINARWLR